MLLRKKIATVAFCFVIAFAFMATVPQATSASTSVNMHLVCQYQNYNTSWAAKLVDSSSVYGWKCWNRQYPEQYWLGPHFDANVNFYCWGVEGTSAYFTNVNDPYSWRCH